MLSGLIVLALCGAITAPLRSASSSANKVPITTSSEEARKEYLLGRDLSDRLQAQESLPHFDRAIAMDPGFAAAELARANNSQTPKEAAEHMKKAVTLADKTSDGERLAILATAAGASGDAASQKAYWEKLVATYPDDERAHFGLALYFSAQQDIQSAIRH